MLLALAAAFAQDPDPEPFPLDFLPATPQPAPEPTPVPAQPYPVPAPQPYPAPAPVPSAQPYPMPAPAPVAPAPTAPVQLRTQDPVFLAPLQPTDGSLDAEARRLDQVLRNHLAQYYPITGIESVPPWPDYSAQIYVAACPPGHYTGCALVCGDRVGSRWTVGGTLSRTGTGVNVDLVFIGNESSRELLQFGVALTGTNDAALGSSADTILKKIVEGAFDAVDLRLLEGDPREQEKLKRAQNDLLAESLAELEQQQGAVQRTDLDVKQNKLTKEQLDAIRTGEQVKPWETVGMSQSEYRRYRNSGRGIDEWRRLRRGRFGQVIARVGIGGGVGPYGQYFDGRYAVDGPDVLDLRQYQYVGQAPHFMGDFELGFGVLPFLDITGHYATRQGRFRYLINQEQVGNPVFVDDPVQRGISSWSAGARLAFVPLQVAPIRPALHAGILYWQGKTWQRVFGLATFTEMRNMSLIAAQVGPGVEIRTGRYLDLFARALGDIPIGGVRSETYSEGGNTLQEPADTESFKTSAFGFTFQVGVVGRLTLIQGSKAGRGSSMRFEEEEEGL